MVAVLIIDIHHCRFSTEKIAKVCKELQKHGYEISALKTKELELPRLGALRSGRAVEPFPESTLADTKLQLQGNPDALPGTCGFWLVTETYIKSKIRVSFGFHCLLHQYFHCLASLHVVSRMLSYDKDPMCKTTTLLEYGFSRYRPRLGCLHCSLPSLRSILLPKADLCRVSGKERLSADHQVLQNIKGPTLAVDFTPELASRLQSAKPSVRQVCIATRSTPRTSTTTPMDAVAI